MAAGPLSRLGDDTRQGVVVKVKRATSVSATSRRPTKPVEASAAGPDGPSTFEKPRGARGSASADDWIRVQVNHIAAPQGSHRQGFGKSVKETNPRTEPYRQAVADACEGYIDDRDDWVPLDGHLQAEFIFYLPPAPKSDPDRPYPNVAPDLDKLIRSTCDGITRGKLWKDDARLVDVRAMKLHADSLEDTRVLISVRRIA